MNAILNEINARQAESNAENNVDDSTTRYIQYAQTEKNVVVQAQTAMNTYYKLQYQLESLKKNRELLEMVLTSTQGRQGQGLATAAEVLTAQQNLQSADAQIISMENQIESTRQNLIIMLGWAQGARPEICPMPEADVERIGSMNIEKPWRRTILSVCTSRIWRTQPMTRTAGFTASTWRMTNSRSPWRSVIPIRK